MTGYREGVIKQNDRGGHFIQWDSGDKYHPERESFQDDGAAVVLAKRLAPSWLNGADDRAKVAVARMILNEAAYEETPLGMCEGCEEPYPVDDLSDQCGCSDDGSGQHVKDLNEMLCEDCHAAYHEPVEVD